ncbi:MAG TPA: class I SAM-dependent methyltransferase [Polyangiaceae bacterium]|nr:class I SAM-dependent methyltransferase [Polyangiaceae bacterium]
MSNESFSASEQASHFQFELIARACPGCGASESQPFADANIDPHALGAFAFASRKLPEYMHHALVVCRKCDLLYANPAPDRKSLEAAYRDAAFDASDESRYAGLTYASYLPRILARLSDRKGALDIGTGDGAFLLQLLQHGFTDVVGVEPSAAPVASAKPEVRSLIRHAAFRSADFAPESLRLVTCFQTIEHVYDPFALCRAALGLLRPGGALFMVCHNRRALLARALGMKSPIFDIEHLQLFSPQSVRALLARAGFSRVDVHTVVNRYPINYWARLSPIPAALKPRTLELLRSSGIGRFTLAAPVGNLAVIAYK